MSIAIAIAISSSHILAVAMTVGLAVFFTLAVWFTSVPPAFALSGDEVTLRGKVQRKTMSKSELIGVFRGRLRVRGSSTNCYWLVPPEGSSAFGAETRYFDPDSFEEAIGRLGVPIKGDFSVPLSAIDAELWLRQG